MDLYQDILSSIHYIKVIRKILILSETVRDNYVVQVPSNNTDSNI